MAVFYRKVSDTVLKQKYSKALKASNGEIKMAARIVGHSHVTFAKYARQFGLVQKRKTRTLTYNGMTKSLSQWAKELKVPYERLHGRLRSMTVKKAFTMPYKKAA